jgi:hypothetical protein
MKAPADTPLIFIDSPVIATNGPFTIRAGSGNIESDMTMIRFTDRESKRRALETLAGEYSFKSWASGEMLLPEAALTLLAREDIPFTFEGSAAYEKLAPLRDSTPVPV